MISQGERLTHPPKWFTETMRAEWRRLVALPHVNSEHRAAVEHACVLYDRFVQDAQDTRKMTASERQTFHSLYMQLGCTPASSAKVPAIKAGDPSDPWATFPDAPGPTLNGRWPAGGREHRPAATVETLRERGQNNPRN
jgi:phage terminase small subunit